jgi:hypothetical protein
MPSPATKPKNYFLNENHELTTVEKSGFAPQVKYRVNWSARGKQLHDSLERVRGRAERSHDPLSKRKYYLLAGSSREFEKVTKSKKGIETAKLEVVSFGGEQSKFFERIGLDLIEVHPNGAIVHARPEVMAQLVTKTAQLAQLGAREQARFVAFESFDWISGNLKFDQEWLDEIGQKPAEGYIKLQPLITELEADMVIRSLDEFFHAHTGVALLGKGRSYMGRYFLRAKVNAQLVKKLANEFVSIQAIHPPLIALASALPPDISLQPSSARPAAIPHATSLPCVGVVDTAVPPEHDWLKAYRRAIVLGANCANTENDNHGSMVASRVVYGDVDLSNSATLPAASCRFLEVRVGTGQSNRILSESVSGALANAIAQAPDVRVFNLSFDKRLDGVPQTQRATTLRHIEEIDNFAFDQDALLVVAAGNPERGVIPNPDYPLHFDDPGWQLQSYPRAFNALTCGSMVPRLSAGGLASVLEAPSPICRVGPGFAGSRKPDFCATAGNTDENHNPLPGSGVWGFSALGQASEGFGTSLAAPLLAREAAFVLESLRSKCPEDSRPFACAAKAILALTADDVGSRVVNRDSTLKPLVERTLGYGCAGAARFKTPPQSRARFIWQGVLKHEGNVVRVQLPIPAAWVTEANSPHLQIAVAWDTPVNSAAEIQWSCRDVEIKVRPGPDAKAVYSLRDGSRVGGYPLFKRTWNFEKAREKKIVEGDAWTLEFSYSKIAAYAAGHFPSPAQRIAFAAEIWDDAEEPVEPHSYVQSLPIASTLMQLSNTSAWLPQVVAITSEI